MNRYEAIRELESALDVEPSSLSEETNLKNVSKWDSVGQLSVIATFDASLDIVLSPSSMSKCNTVKDLIDLLTEKLS